MLDHVDENVRVAFDLEVEAPAFGDAGLHSSGSPLSGYFLALSEGCRRLPTRSLNCLSVAFWMAGGASAYERSNRRVAIARMQRMLATAAAAPWASGDLAQVGDEIVRGLKRP